MSALQSADMARIYDNIESKFVNGLQDLITDVGIKRVDFCVGYFNLRGWDLVVNHKEISDELQRLCRVHETQPREGQATYIVWDVVPRNVLVDADGDMYVVNAEIKKL